MELFGREALPKDGDYWCVAWRTAAMAAPAFTYFDSAEEALAHRDKVRARGETAEVYRRNQSTRLNEGVP